MSTRRWARKHRIRNARQAAKCREVAWLRMQYALALAEYDAAYQRHVETNNEAWAVLRKAEIMLAVLGMPEHGSTGPTGPQDKLTPRVEPYQGDE